MFEELIIKRFDKIKNFINEINRKDLTYCFQSNTAGNRFDDFSNGIELLKKYNLMKGSQKK